MLPRIQRYNIKIALENIFLGIRFLNIDGSENLSDFTLYSCCSCSFVISGHIFYSLLRYRRTALLYSSKGSDDGSKCSLEVYSVMRIKTLVLSIYKSILNILRNILKIHPLNLFLLIFQSIIKQILL